MHRCGPIPFVVTVVKEPGYRTLSLRTSVLWYDDHLSMPDYYLM